MGRIAIFREQFEDIIEEVLKEDLSDIDACELGEIVDCLKDMCEAEYYREVVNAMEESDYGKELMPQSVRERMYFNNTKTFDEIMNELSHLIANETSEELVSMKEKLTEFINKL